MDDSRADATGKQACCVSAWPASVAVGGGMAYVLLLAFAPGFAASSPIACLVYRGLGLHCPTCGLTRSFACLVRLDMAGALSYNPLVVLAAPLAALLIVDAFLAGFRRQTLMPRVPPSVVRAYWLACAFMVVMLFIIRLTSWLAPAYNPGGWLIPPPTFPA